MAVNYRTLGTILVCISGIAACATPAPPGYEAPDTVEQSTGGTSTIAASNANFADALPPPSHDGNTIGQVSLTPAVCPTPTNANDYFGLARCCNTHAQFCEDFESGTAGQAPDANVWAVNKATTDTVEISASQHARGSQSLHIHSLNSGGQHAMIANTTAFPFANNVFWGRAFVYWNGTVYPNNHTTYVAAAPNPNPNYEWMRYSSFGSGNLGGNDADPDNSSNSSTHLPSMSWACLEWFYNTPGMQAQYYFNGQLISTLTIDPKHTTATTDLTWGQVELGWELYSQDGTAASWDMYFDEIALNGTRIGCAN